MGSRLKKTVIIIVALILAFVLYLLIPFYAMYPSLLCSSIKQQSNKIDFLLSLPFGNCNWRTQPKFMDPITVRLFEAGGELPLVVACQEGDLETAKKLLQNGADPLKSSGFSPIEAVYASPKKENRLELAKLLVENGADVTAHVSDIEAIFYEMNYAKDGESSWENILFLLDAGASTVNEYGSTLLHYAALQNARFVAEQLFLMDEMKIDTQNEFGQTALMWAARAGHNEMVQFLLDHNANISLQDTDGKTAYDYALEKGYTEIAALLG